MKILKITYKKVENDEVVNEVSFNTQGLSIVLGKIENKTNLKETTNGVGKSIIMKTINYIYGANNDESIYSKLGDYYFDATIRINNCTHVVRRYLKQNGEIYFNGRPITLEEYKEKIGTDRSEIRKLILLGPRNMVCETPGAPYNSNDLTAIFKIIGLKTLSELIANIKSKQDEIAKIRKTNTQLLELMDVDAKQIEERRIKNKNELDQIRLEEEAIKEKIKSLSINDINSDIQKDFEIDNREIKRLRKENYNYESELSQLEEYLQLSTNFSIETSEIEKIYEEAGVFLNKELVIKLSDVEIFYKQILEDRKKQIEQRTKTLRDLIRKNTIDINQLNKSLSNKSAILSKNDAYQNGILLLSDLQNKIDDLMLESGRLEQYSKITSKEKSLNLELESLFKMFTEEHIKAENLIDEYKKFVYNTSKRLYDEDAATLEIDYKKMSLKGLPASIEIELRKEKSGGVTLVKNILFDYMLFNADTKNEILLHDSGCFSDIDTRQVATLLNIGHEIAVRTGKQYIVSINGYDIHDSAINFIDDKVVIELSESNLLLKKVL